MDKVAPNGEEREYPAIGVFSDKQGGRKEAGKSGERLQSFFLFHLYCQMKQAKAKPVPGLGPISIESRFWSASD